jgi:hypothetical protein
MGEGGMTDRSKPKQVTGRLKIACDRMIWEGETYDVAAKAVGLTARAMRKALERPHVCAYLKAGKVTLRSSEGPRTLKRLVTLAHQDRNANAAVAACRAIEHIPSEESSHHWGGQQMQPGLVIVVNAGPGAAPRVVGPSAPPLDTPPLTIDHHFAERED